MSAFIVANETIRRVVSAMIGDQPCEWGDLLGNRLLAMNARAVASRYRDAHEVFVDKFRYLPLFPSKMVQLKAIDCLIYQCTEGKVPEEQLYKELESAQHALMRDIVTHLPEYDAAPWDAA